MAAPQVFDVVLFGATGFTGRLTALYLSRRAAALGGFTWALAGRSLAKLEQLRLELGPAHAALPLIEAGADAAGAAAVASRARCVLSAAGPFALCGEPLVAACAARGVHYADATGETHWVADMETKYGAAARASRAILVPLAGFDSVPSDVGALHCVATARRRGARLARLTAVASVHGALSGGTVATAATMSADARARAAAADPLLLVPGSTRAAREALVAPLPDGEWPTRVRALGELAWTQPHLMAAINTRVVRRSAALFATHGEALSAAAARSQALADALHAPSGGTGGASSYAFSAPGAAFAYRERALARSWLAALGSTLFSSVVGLALTPRVAPLVRRFLPKPGEGPSDAQIRRNSFRLFFVGERADGGPDVLTCISGGDPYLATAQSLAETGLLLAEAARTHAEDELPAAAFGFGFLTPATALGLRLLERLRDAGALRVDEFASTEAAAAAVDAPLRNNVLPRRKRA